MKLIPMKFIAAGFFLFAIAAPAAAAPTCQDRGGNTVHCDTAGAMPLGWTAPQADRHFPHAQPSAVIEAVAIVLLLIALIGLLPDFDGAHWDRQEGDEEE